MSDIVLPNNVSSLRTVRLAEENCQVRTSVEYFELFVSVREVVFLFDFEDTHLSENQLGYMSQLETLEWFWELVRNPQSPRMKEVTPPTPLPIPHIKIATRTKRNSTS